MFARMRYVAPVVLLLTVASFTAVSAATLGHVAHEHAAHGDHGHAHEAHARHHCEADHGSTHDHDLAATAPATPVRTQVSLHFVTAQAPGALYGVALPIAPESRTLRLSAEARRAAPHILRSSVLLI